MRRAEDTDRPDTGRPDTGQPDTGQLATSLLAAVRPPPSRYRNPGDVIGLIAAAGALAAALIAVRETGEPLFGLASGLAAVAVTGCVAAQPWLRPWSRLAAWIVLLAGGTAAVASGAAGPAELAAGGAAGLLAGFGVRVALGVPDRRLGPDGIAAALSSAGLPVGPLRPAGRPGQGLAAVRGGRRGRAGAVHQGARRGSASGRPAVPGLPGRAAQGRGRPAACRLAAAGRRASGAGRRAGRTGGRRRAAGARCRRGAGRHRAAGHGPGAGELAGPAPGRGDHRRPAAAALDGAWPGCTTRTWPTGRCGPPT